MRLLTLVFTALCFLQFSPTNAQNSVALDELATSHQRHALLTLKELLSIPNDAHYPAQVQLNVDWCKNAFSKRGFSLTQLNTGGPPLLLAEKQIRDKDAATILIYLQIDGQPVDSAHWYQPSPYLPVLKEMKNDKWEIIPWNSIEDSWNEEWRVFARSASDAKGPVAMLLTSLDIMNEKKWKSNYNIKVIMDFEEELGSPHLPEAVHSNRDALASDALIILDGPRHVTNQPTLTFGARGIATITLTLFGPRTAQHSGHYGNYAPNPALRLSQLIGSMKDAEGKVIISGYYDGINISKEVLEILESVPDDETMIRNNIGIADIDKVADSYQKSIQYPSLNIRGLSSGWVGDEVRTIIPDKAIAEIDVRLVMESDPERLIGLIRNHVESMGYHIIASEPTESDRQTYDKLIRFDYEVSYLAFRTAFDSPVGLWLNKGLTRAFDQVPIRQRTSGGSIPISPFVTTLSIPAVTVPTVNRDNNQHSPNENLRLGNLKDGIITILAILTEEYPSIK